MNNKILSFLTFLLLLASCSDFSYTGKGKDIPVAGELELWIDQGDSLVMAQMIDMFQSEYPKAEIKAIYASEADILKAINSGECKACILNRNFSPGEIEAIESGNVKVRSAHIAKTSVAVISNKINPLKQLSQNELKAILLKDFAGTGKAEIKEIVPVFDHVGGSNFQALRNSLFPALSGVPSHIRSLRSPSSVMAWVAEHENALGFVGVNWLSDNQDTSAFKYLRKLNIVKIQGDSDQNYHYPFQSQIKTRQYPFRLEMYIHDIQGYSGLASGLTAYICSQPGQVLIKKSGLLPAVDHGRTIELGNP